MIGLDARILRRLFGEARPYWLLILATFCLSLLAAPLTLLTPVPLKIVVDNVIGDHPPPGWLDALVPHSVLTSNNALLIFTCAMFAGVALLTELQSLSQTVLQTYTGEKLLLRFRSKLFQQSQRLSLMYHDSVGTADSTYRVIEDAKSVQYVASESLIALVTAAVTLVAMLYVTFTIDWVLALITVAVTPILGVLSVRFRQQLRVRSRQVKKLESGALSVIQEVFTGLRLVKAFSQEEHEHARFRARATDGMLARVRLAFAKARYSLAVGAVVGVGGALVLYAGARRVESGAITLGDLILVMGYLAQLYAPVKSMAKNAGTLQNFLASAERAFGLLDQAPDVPERADARPITRAAGAVEFEDVSFEYQAGRPALHEVSFAVPAGAKVGIAGHTGAGKSTLMNLLIRFHDPTSGRIELDGLDIREYRLADLRRQFGIVLQEPILFSTTVAENIAYARPDATSEAIEEAACAANADEFIAALPEGYDTQVGERGMRLSGGERQRISLARAFLRDAPILILDEPTSSVDVETEAIILQAMERLMAGRTSFMIAHRLSTLDICDMRLELVGGDLVQTAPAQAERSYA